MENRRRGVITSWDDARLFGFITPEEGGEELFFHISAWAQARSCPVEGFTVSYTIAEDPERGPQANQVRLCDKPYLPTPAGSPMRNYTRRRNGLGVLASICVALASLGAIAFAAHRGLVPLYVPAIYALASLAALLAYSADKQKAQTGRWRMSESRLHFVELIGGWPGALVAQQLFRHKNRKGSYQLEYWCIVALHVGVLGWVVLRGGQWTHFSLAEWVRSERSVFAPHTPGRAPGPSGGDANTITINESDFRTGRKR
jgi:uncharacterized membrane protein YsdA (DUF1294 family)/cold shock CspA family protein